MHSKVGSQKPTSANKPDATSINSKRQLGSNNGTGPGRPAGPKFLPSKTPASSIMQKKASSPSAKKILPAMHKSLPSNPSKSSVPKQHWEQRKGLQEPNKARPIPKQPLSSLKSQVWAHSLYFNGYDNIIFVKCFFISHFLPGIWADK